MQKNTNAFSIKSQFTHSLLWVTKFSMLSTSADQNGDLVEQIALTLMEICPVKELINTPLRHFTAPTNSIYCAHCMQHSIMN